MGFKFLSYKDMGRIKQFFDIKVKRFLGIKFEYIRRIILSYILRIRYNDMYVYIPESGFEINYDFFVQTKYICAITLYYRLSKIKVVIIRDGKCVYYRDMNVYSMSYKEVIDYIDIVNKMCRESEVDRLLGHDVNVAIVMRSMRYINNV